ncbi:hypothetical protein FTX61_13325 [Nitriliruptoraceae bacterium ZYF776]|nr:hypothetical protein [Profundirhabdus halotolerans]
MRPPPDPRPRTETGSDGAVLVGQRCAGCGTVNATARARCPDCRGELHPARFGPGGRVWSATVVRIPVPGRQPPYAVAYVDLDDGPRVLAHVTNVEDAPTPGTRVRLTTSNDHGDVVVEVDA